MQDYLLAGLLFTAVHAALLTAVLSSGNSLVGVLLGLVGGIYSWFIYDFVKSVQK